MTWHKNEREEPSGKLFLAEAISEADLKRVFDGCIKKPTSLKQFSRFACILIFSEPVAWH